MGDTLGDGQKAAKSCQLRQRLIGVDSDIVKKFVEEECIPADAVGHAQIPTGEGRWVSLNAHLFASSAQC